MGGISVATFRTFFLAIVMTVKFEKCSRRSCLTCTNLIKHTNFTSSVNGSVFNCCYNFDQHEKNVISCTSVNLVYLLICDGCGTQYVGETVQELRDRTSQHRATTRPGKSGNFRLRQHFSESNGRCTSFKIQVIQKLPGDGRTAEQRPNSHLFEIDEAVTARRKAIEDNWIRRVATQYPYGLNDRIDSLKDKNLYNCEYAKFISSKERRTRSWSKSKLDTDPDIIVNTLVDMLVKENFHSSMNSRVRKLIFPLPKKLLISIKDRYVNQVFNMIDIDPMKLQLHYIIMDIFMYKIKPLIDNSILGDYNRRT